MKICTVCRQYFPLIEFGKNLACSDSLHYRCKKCCCEQVAMRKQKLMSSEDTLSIYLEKKSKTDSSYRKRNRGKCNHWSRGYYTKKSNAFLKCLTTEDKLDIKRIYEMSEIFEDMFGVKMNVDHIVPLNNPIVCGLHVPWNLQIVFSTFNMRKGNKLGDEWGNV